MRDHPEFIGVDWGSSRLRVHLLDRHGSALETIEIESGILKTDRGAQGRILMDALRPWASAMPGIPVYAAGMIGSRSGLVETTPLDTPAELAGLAAAVHDLDLGDGTKLRVVPGLVDRGGEHSDLIRGEEVQAFGWLEHSGEHDSSLLVLPGTHSKWIRAEGQAITSFHTFPTGELFAAVLGMPSIAQAAPEEGRSADAVERDRSFREGVVRGSEARGLLHDLFTIRTRLLEDVGEHSLVLNEYLSGMLIAYEIAEAVSRGYLLPGEAVVLISEGELLRRYGIALELLAIGVTEGGASNFGRGIAAIHRRISHL